MTGNSWDCPITPSEEQQAEPFCVLRPWQQKDISQRNKEKRFKKQAQRDVSEKKRRHLFLLLHFCLPFCTIFRNAARMSETFLIIDMMLGSRVPNYDAWGLFRALHSHNPHQYSHIVGLSSHFYLYAPLRSEQNEHPLDVLLHIGAGPKVFHPPVSKLMWI